MKFSFTLLIKFLTILMNHDIIKCPSSWAFDDYAVFLIEEFYPKNDFRKADRVLYLIEQLKINLGGDSD